jgi:hypothetical protein
LDVPATRNGFLQKAGRVLFLAEEKRTALGADGPDQWQALSLARFNMLRALNEFVLFKEEQILLPVLTNMPNDATQMAKRLKEDNLDLQRDYDAFVQRWLMQSARCVTKKYHGEALAMMDHIERSVQVDIDTVNEMLDQVEAAN